MNRAFPLNTIDLHKLRRSLLEWYDEHRRQLPWRTDNDPYCVWVSEIMLQQTRVAAVLEHYSRWMRRFPTVHKLAAARQPSVLAAWSGLGYYHRARRIHQAAKAIVRERRGKFPRTAQEWRTLPGIGRYTAAAIASIAFDEAVALVDGNVERVLTRVFGPTPSKQAVWRHAEALLSPERPGDFNQAMMELGATTCTPRAPQCLLCPLMTWCRTRGIGATKLQAARIRRQLCYGLARRGNSVLLVQRAPDDSLMAGMWELPVGAVDGDNGDAPMARFRHSITNTDYDVSVILLSVKSSANFAPGAKWFTRKQWEQLPLTGLTRKILRRLVVESSLGASQSN